MNGADGLCPLADGLLQEALDLKLPMDLQGGPPMLPEGSEGAPLMVIGEQPSLADVRSRRLFSDSAGAMLESMLEAIGFRRGAGRGETTLAVLSPWPAPGGRALLESERDALRPFALRQIEAAKPRAVLVMGGSAVRALLGGARPLKRAVGRWHRIELGSGLPPVPAMPIQHPQMLISRPEAKRPAWEALKKAKALLDKAGKAGKAEGKGSPSGPSHAARPARPLPGERGPERGAGAPASGGMGPAGRALRAWAEASREDRAKALRRSMRTLAHLVSPGEGLREQVHAAAVLLVAERAGEPPLGVLDTLAATTEGPLSESGRKAVERRAAEIQRGSPGMDGTEAWVQAAAGHAPGEDGQAGQDGHQHQEREAGR